MSTYKQGVLLVWQRTILRQKQTPKTPAILSAICFPSQCYNHIGKTIQYLVGSGCGSSKIRRLIDPIAHAIVEAGFPFLNIFISQVQKPLNGRDYRRGKRKKF